MYQNIAPEDILRMEQEFKGKPMGLLTEIADILGRNWGDGWEVHNKIAKEILALINTEQIDAMIQEAKRIAKKQEGERILERVDPLLSEWVESKHGIRQIRQALKEDDDTKGKG